MDDSYLAHYGVKGMKWGVRRDIAKRSGVLNVILYGGLVGGSIEVYKEHKARKYVATGKY